MTSSKSAAPPPIATRDEALARLRDFLPQAGADYARWRNYDFGPGGRNRVSGLSPWIRHRLLCEQEVIDQVIGAHGLDAAEKFIQEVCWRTYWKGYLERRPVHWHDYLAAVHKANAQRAKDRRLAADIAAALNGATGIEAFDAWANALCETGYLHNHARMWFASIWVFTLGLPWALGADFFLRHLLDGDPASNTLSWRWVAGLHTPGKAYIAQSANIHQYTDGRFNPGDQLNRHASPPPAEDRPPIGPCPLPTDWSMTPHTGLLITEDDLHPESLFGAQQWPLVIAVQTTDWRSPDPVAEPVRAFAAAGLADALARNPAPHTLGPIDLRPDTGADAVRDAALDAGVTRLLTPWVPTGPGADAMAELDAVLAPAGITRHAVPRDWDLQCWPAATHGFFRFWKATRPVIAGRQAARSE